MRLSAIGRTIEELDTPALLLDLDAFERNVATMAATFAREGKAWRPHAKAFKSPAIANVLKKAGAIGVTVAKVSEAEVMAAGGIDDILIAHLVVGEAKADRLAALQRRADVKATVDHPDQVAPLGRAAVKAGVTLGLLLDVDLGMKRTGVADPAVAVDLARRVVDTPGLRLDGIMGYEGHTLMIADPTEKRQAIETAIGRLTAVQASLESAGIPCRIVSAGGTGSYQVTAGIEGPTELQAGGGIFACRYYTEVCHVTGHQPALSVLATVVSRPARDRAVLDIGRKSISDYRTPPVLADFNHHPVDMLSAEHATFAVPSWLDESLKVGKKVSVVPGYSDFTFVLHDRVLGIRQGRVESSWELLGRGMLQ
ncbi:MAG: alanine racemase [Isosphaeraceae bacterium]